MPDPSARPSTTGGSGWRPPPSRPILDTLNEGASDADRRIPRRRPLPGRDRPDRGRVEPRVAGPDEGPEGRPERAVRRARRHRVRPTRVLREPDRDADLRRARGGRAPVQQHAHNGALLAEPLVHHHGPQPPQQRHGVHHRARLGLPRLQRRDAVRERDALGDAARARLRHVHGRQVAPDALEPGDGGRAVRPLAARAAASSASTASSAATRASGTRTSSTTTTRSSRRRTPEEGYHLTEDLVDKSIEFITDLRQIDPDKPFYLHLVLRGDPRAAPRAEGVGRPVRRPVRRRLGRLPRAGVRPPEGAGHPAAPTRSCRATTRTSPRGSPCHPRRAGCRLA